MGIVDSIKERIKAKENAKNQALLDEQIKIEGDKSFALYQQFTTANANKVGQAESSVVDYEAEGYTGTEKRTIVYSEFGPIIKSEIEARRQDDFRTYVDEFTKYEGYLNSTKDKDISGYFKIEVRDYISSNPVDRESHHSVHYDGIHRKVLGDVVKISNSEIDGQLESSNNMVAYQAVEAFKAIIAEKVKNVEQDQNR